MDYNSSRRFRHEVQESSVALSIKCDSWPYELRKPFTTDRFFPHKNPYISNVTHATALQSNARLLNCASPTAVEFKFL